MLIRCTKKRATVQCTIIHESMQYLKRDMILIVIDIFPASSLQLYPGKNHKVIFFHMTFSFIDILY